MIIWHLFKTKKKHYSCTSNHPLRTDLVSLHGQSEQIKIQTQAGIIEIQIVPLSLTDAGCEREKIIYLQYQQSAVGKDL